MITFHEGLPRSGKSYEALVEHILTNVKKGRKIFAYIEGLNHQKIAELTEKTEEEVQALLIQIDREDVLKIYDVVDDNSFVIIDELQNFFPSGRQKLDDKMTQFVTEHGHRGLDILAMGQSLADCHNLWKRRVEVKMTFTKLTAVGKPNSYKWEVYRGHLRGDGNVKFSKIRSGIKKYNPVYFGSYASHVSSDTNTTDYIDDRTNIFKSATFRFGLPAAILVGIYAVNFLIGFFNGEVKAEPQVVQVKQVQETQKDAEKKARKQAAIIPVKAYVDYFDEVLSRNNHRLTGTWKFKHYTEATIEVVDSSYHQIERFTNIEIAELGWRSTFTRYGLILRKQGSEHLIRFKPFDPVGSVNDSVNPDLVSN